MEPATGFTISMWVFPTEIQKDKTYVILNKGGTSQDYRLYINTSRLLVFRVNDLTPNELKGPILPVNQWSHITAIYDQPAGMLKLFLNGILVASHKVTGAISYDTTAGITIGAATNSFIGMVDEVYLNQGAMLDSDVIQTATAVATPSVHPTSTITPSQTSTPLPTNTSITHTPTFTKTSTPTKTATPVTSTATATNTATNTPLPNDGLRGTGADGDLTVVAGTAFYINTQNSNGRACADGGDAVTYNITGLGSTVATLNVTPSANCLKADDEILLINLQGVPGNTYNTGKYEFLRIASINGAQVSFTTPKVNWYGSVAFSDANIGTGAGQQKVMLMRVPNYRNVTVNGTLTGSYFPWMGSKGGVVAFRVNETLNGNGVITVTGLGYGSTTGYAGAYVSTAYGGGGAAPNNGGGGGPGGGGGYGTIGISGSVAGGSVYGQPGLGLLFHGGGGGKGGDCTLCDEPPGPSGGSGGGILWIGAQTINFQGSLRADGTDGGQAHINGNGGGGGAGGSIRIEGHTITLGTVSATGGTYWADGGQGRIAIYYQNTEPSITSSSPSPYIAPYGQSMTATPVPSPTPISLTPPPVSGNGADGDLTVAVGTAFYINTQNSNGRVCIDGGDAVTYNIIELTDSWAKLSASPSNGCLKPGDEILLLNLQGVPGNTYNTGKYEFLRIGGLTGNIVYFSSVKSNFYGANAGDDSNIGTGTGQQNVMLMRVPNYRNVMVNGTLTGSPWMGTKNGVVAFRVNETLNGSGAITVNSLGYDNGTGYAGTYVSSAYGGGSIGDSSYGRYGDGAGGGYGTAGQSLGGSAGGSVYGQRELDLLFPGGGGGLGGNCTSSTCQDHVPGSGGTGGGILWIGAHTIDFSGSITSNGGNGYDGQSAGTGGAAAGGSIRIEGDSITLGTVSATGGTYYADGGYGRIAVYYANSFSNSATICAQTSTYCRNTNQIDDAPVPLGAGIYDDTVSNWVYSGNWVAGTVTGPANSTYHSTGMTDAYAELLFNGTQFTLTFTKNTDRGLIDVYVDGVKIDTINANNASAVWQSTWTSPAYSAGTHTVRLVHAGGGTYIDVDAIQIFGDPVVVPAGTYDDTHVAWKYSGLWNVYNGSGPYNSTLHQSNDSGSSAELTFIGTGITLTYLKAAGRGSIDVYIDGTKVGAINANNASTLWQQTWTNSTLSAGVHTIRLTNAGGSWIDLDAITITGSVSGDTYDDTGTAWTYTGAWTAYTGSGPYNNTLHYTSTVGDSAQVQFTGTQFTLLFTKSTNRGNLEIWVDGVKTDTLNAYHPTNSVQNWYTKSGLAAGTHTMMVKHAGPTGTYIDVDAIQILDLPPVLPPTPAPQAGWQETHYHYDGAQPHAATSLTEEQSSTKTHEYEYDANGNMTCRVEDGVTYRQNYNAENRISSIAKINGDCDNLNAEIVETWMYAYDGNGTRVSTAHTTGLNSTPDSMSAYFMGGAYEVTNGAVRKYYSFAGQTIMRDADGLKYFLSDHLGSTSVVLDANGGILEQQRYLPFGEARVMPPYASVTSTDFTYTGQRNLEGTGLMDYKARFYSAYLNQFTQPDTIVPNLYNPQSLNRYSYVLNNPLRYTDPSGHKVCDDVDKNGRCFTLYSDTYIKAILKRVIKDPQDRNAGNVLLKLIAHNYKIPLAPGNHWAYDPIMVVRFGTGAVIRGSNPTGSNEEHYTYIYLSADDPIGRWIKKTANDSGVYITGQGIREICGMDLDCIAESMTHEAVHSWIEYKIEGTGAKPEKGEILNNEEIFANRLAISYVKDPNSKRSQYNKNIFYDCSLRGYFCSGNYQTLEDFYHIDLSDLLKTIFR